MHNYKKVIRLICLLALCVIFALWQTAVCPKFKIFSVQPDIVLSLVTCMALFEGPKKFCICAVFAGFITEALGGGALISYMPLLFLICACITFYFKYNFFGNSFRSAIISACVSFILEAAIISAISAFVWSSISITTIILTIALPFFLYSLICTIPTYFVCKLFSYIFQERKRKKGYIYY